MHLHDLLIFLAGFFAAPAFTKRLSPMALQTSMHFLLPCNEQYVQHDVHKWYSPPVSQPKQPSQQQESLLHGMQYQCTRGQLVSFQKTDSRLLYVCFDLTFHGVQISFAQLLVPLMPDKQIELTFEN